jgi:hypothetical protein
MAADNNLHITIAQGQEALYAAFDEYLERAQLHASISRDYACAADVPGMAYSLRKLRMYVKAASAELAAIVDEQRRYAEDTGGSPSAVVPVNNSAETSSDKEWWEQ